MNIPYENSVEVKEFISALLRKYDLGSGQRMTRKNPGMEKRKYRIWCDRAGEFRMDTQNGSPFIFGDVADRLGRLEDLLEELKK